MAENGTTATPIDTWRQFITDSERQWNSFFKDVLGTDGMSNALNAWVEGSLTVQRMVADQLERLYTTFNIPTHGDLVDLGERMKAIEESLARIEAAAPPAAPRRRASAKPAPKRRPKRTRRPPVTASANSA
jgi:hypothetical protein